MGRPVILRCRGGDRDTEVTDGYSRPGNRPTHASITQSRNKQRTSESKWPSALPALSESRKDPDRDQTRRTNSVTVNIHTKTTDTSAHRTNTQTCGEPLPGGDHAEVAGPTLPLCHVSENASDFWGPQWASQLQIAKIAAISVR